MQRPLKFRVWSKITKMMSPAVSLKTLTYELTDDLKKIDPFNEAYVVFMQFTNLVDKHKKEIYEGDILSQNLRNEFGSFQKQVGIMKWHTSGYWAIEFKSSMQILDAEPPEIIGNIYENKGMIPV